MGQRQSCDEPVDAKWVAANAVEMQIWGRIAVRMQNEKQSWNLQFRQVCKAWDMSLDRDSGNLYLLHLIALKDDQEVKYSAILWLQSDLHRNVTDTWKLISFKELEFHNPKE